MEKIIRGEKKATLRLGIKDYNPGDVVMLRAGDVNIGLAKIKEVNIKKFKELSDDDIRIDGFHDKKSLLMTLQKFYGEIKEEEVFTQIIFELL